MGVCYNDVVNKMIEVIPELVEPYNECIEWLEEPLPYVVFGQTLNPYIIELLKNDEKNVQKLKSIFEFFEEMANSEDDVVTLLVTSTLEFIAFDELQVYNTSKKYAKSETLKWLKKLRNE